MQRNIIIREGKPGCGCGCGCFALIIPIIIVALFAGFFNWASNEENLNNLTNKLEDRFNGEEAVVSQEQIEVIATAFKAIETDNYELFEEIAAKDLSKYLSNEELQTTGGLYASIRDSFHEEFGDNFTIKADQLTGRNIDLVVVKATEITCTGIISNGSGDRPVVIEVGMTQQDGNWKVFTIGVAE